MPRMDRQIAAIQERLRLQQRFRAAARLSVRVNQPRSPGALLNFLFRGGATGIEALIRLDSPLRMTYNSLLYVAMLGVSITLIAKGFEKYFAYGIVTSLDLTDNLNGVVLPAVTVCNVNGFKRSVFCSDQNIQVTAKLCSVEDKSEFAALFVNESFDPATYGRLQAIANASTFTEGDLIKSCFVKHLPCSDDLVVPTVVSYQRFGMCYCLFCDAKLHGNFVRFTKSSGLYGGLSLVLDSHKDDMLSSTKSSGFIVMLHEPDAFPDVNADGFNIIDGRTNFFGISYTTVERLPKPYVTNCRMDWPAEFSRPPFEDLALPYATPLCIKVCSSLAVLRACGCRTNGELTYRDYLDIGSLCLDNNSTRACRADLSTQHIPCNCPPTCKETFYRVQVAGASFAGGNANDDNTTYSRLIVYYNEIAAQTFREVPRLDRVQFVNLVGGNFGMFVGVSFLILYEVLEIHVRWLAELGQLWRKRRRQR